MDVKRIFEVDLQNDRYQSLYDIKDLICLKPNNYSEVEVKSISNILGIEYDVLSSYPNWYILNNEFYYFKYKRFLAELIMDEIFEKYNVPHLDHQIALCDNRIGIISKNFRKSGSTYLNYNDFFKNIAYSNHCFGLEDFILSVNLKSNYKDAKDIVDTTHNIIALDYLTGQIDRYEYNVLFEKTNDSIRYAPLFDNGCSFMNSLPTYKYNSCYDIFYFPKDKEFSLVGEENTIHLLNENFDLFNAFEKVLYLDINNILERVIEKHGLDLSNDIIKYINEFVKFRKNVVENTLTLCKKES